MIKKLLSFVVVVLALFISVSAARAESATSSAKLKFPVTIDGVGTCNNLAECKVLCDTPTNRDACTKWYQSQPFYKKPPIEVYRNEILEAAKGKLGCDSVETCKAACTKVENQQVCTVIQLAIRATFKNEPPKDSLNILKEKIKQYDTQEKGPDAISAFVPNFVNPQTGQKQITIAGQTCTDFACVKKICDNVQNKTDCDHLAREFGLKVNQASSTQINNEVQKQCQNYSPCKELCAKDPEKCKQLLQNYQKEGTKSAQPNIKPQNYQPSGYPKPYFNPQNGLPHPSSGAYPPQGVPASTPNSATYNGSTSGFYSPVPQPSAVPQVRGVKIVTSFFDRLFSLVFGN